eukprot:TRINITY_DN78334_c0_g1_i1.p1 TRINITY_DN78334_c0_g1~~TRINITY_DN78334_c0_g1_i1.p1  ORF type:complete len:460 (-),score=68.42 TRINITY_DN78334_c0_g1_i1:67-1404(-)
MAAARTDRLNSQGGGDGGAFERVYSTRSRVRAWSFYAALGYVSVTVVVIGLTMDDLAESMGFEGKHASLELHPVFLGRMFGALGGTLLGGLLCDFVPIKLMMSCCIILSSLTLASIPLVALWGLWPLIVCFGVLGIVGAALVCSATTAACWAFPGKRVGPVLSGCAAAYGISSSILPCLLPLLRGSVSLQFAASGACALPALVLVFASSAPEKPVQIGGNGCNGSGGHRSSRHPAGDWAMACLAAFAQLLLQGTNASLIVWLVSFGKMEVNMGDAADVLVSVLQGGVTIGSLVAMRYQRHFNLLDLACLQLALVTTGAGAWFTQSSSAIAAFVAVTWYGVIGGSTLGYCSALYNQYTTPSGAQLSLVNLGSNCGSGLGPFVTGVVMKRYGPLALVATVFVGSGLVLVGMVIVQLIVRRHSNAAVAREVQEAGNDESEGLSTGLLL